MSSLRRSSEALYRRGAFVFLGTERGLEAPRRANMTRSRSVSMIRVCACTARRRAHSARNNVPFRAVIRFIREVSATETLAATDDYREEYNWHADVD